MKDDDEEEENTFGVVRYPCMPSLVALQQMRNRLHLAFLGRKLMKWTALATGREMRRIAVELYDVYQGFGEDMRNAFILLARSRYFYPQLNHIVTEDIAKKAAVIVQQSSRSVSGVKIVQFEIFETECPPYEHLGIEKGGQTIMETKKAWLELLKRIIMMMQLRTSFIMVELANKNATKKMNVLKKIVVPRTNVTIGYILTELEEMAREEFHRMKKIKEKKKKEKQLRNKNQEAITSLSSSAPCKICERNSIGNVTYTENLNKTLVVPIKMSQTIFEKINEQTEPLSDKTTIVDVEQMEHEVLSITSAKKALPREASTQSRLTYLKTHLSELISHGRELLQTSVKNLDIKGFIKICEETKLKLDQLFEIEDDKPKLLDEKLKKKLEYLKSQLYKVIDITNEFQSEVKLSSSVENFIRMCQNVGNKLDICKQTISVTQEHSHKSNLDELRDLINDVKKIIKEYKIQGLLAQNVDIFLKSCDLMSSKLQKLTALDINKNKLKLDQEFKPDQHKVAHEQLDRKLEHLKCHLREVIDITEEFKPELNISPSVEDFIRICQEVNEKLDFNKEGQKLMQNTDEKTKLEELREIINGVTKITQDYKKKGIVSVSVDEFLESCDEIKLNIDKSMSESTKKLEFPGTLQEQNKILEAPLMQIKTEIETDTNLLKLINCIDDAIRLGVEAKEEGLMYDSADDFLNVFEEIKNQVGSASKQPKVLKDLQLNIQEIMNLIKKLKEEGVITANVEDILKSCEKTKTKIDINFNKRTPSCSTKNDTGTMSECIESCINRKSNLNLSKNNEQEQLRSQNIYDKDALCRLCSGVLDIKEPSDESLCIDCSNSVNEETEIFQSTPATISEESNLCDYSEKIISDNTPSVKNEETKSETVSASENLGYFEKKVQKKIKVTRRQNPDGTIWEEKETITINKVKHDPTETFLLDDEDDSSDEDLDNRSSKQVNICILPSLIRKDINLISKSAHSNMGYKNNSLTEPFLRQYLSLDNIFFDG